MPNITEFYQDRSGNVTIEKDNGTVLNYNASDVVTVQRDGSGNVTGLTADGQVVSSGGGAGITDGDKGDIVVSGAGGTFTIDNEVVSNSKLATTAQATIKGRAAASGTGTPVDLTPAQARTILNVADGATANTGTVTNVSMSVPTGLTVAGSPVTTSGSLDVTLTAGYSIPTTTKQTEWDNKAAASHAHAIANVTGLETALADKLSASTAVPVTNKSTAIVALDRFLITNSENSGIPAEVSPAQVATSVGATSARLAAIDAEIAEVALGSKRVYNKTTAVHYVFGAYATMLEEMRKLCFGFGTSTPDTQLQGGLVHTNTLWYDPVNGSDANDGSTLALAKQTIPNPLYGGTSRKIMLPSGLTLNGQSYQPGTANTVLSVYDSLNTSPTYGQEITWYPNPFVRALMGGWVTSAEKARWYVTFDGQQALDSTATISGVVASNASVAITNCVRGVVFRNWGYAGARANANTTFRVEDCVFEDCRRTPTPANSYYGGNAIRVEAATSKLDVARCFFERVGMDVVWCVADSFGHKFADIAVKHTCEDQLYGIQHSDVIQFGGGYPGDFLLRRAVLSLQTREGPLLNSGNGETNSGGAITIASNAGATVRTGGLVEDVVMLSSYQQTYFHEQAGVTHRRVVALNYGRNANNPGTSGFAMQSVGNVMEDCVLASYNTTFPAWGPYATSHTDTSSMINLGRLDS